MRSSAGTPGGAQNWAGSRPLKPVPCSIAPGSLTGIFPMPLRAPVQRSRNFLGLGLTPCAASLSVEGSRLARRPPRKRRVAAFTPRSETTIGTGLNSSKRDDIQTIDSRFFGLLFCGAMERKTGLSNWPFYRGSLPPLNSAGLGLHVSVLFFPFRELARGSGWALPRNAKVFRPFLFSETGRRLFIRSKD